MQPLFFEESQCAFYHFTPTSRFKILMSDYKLRQHEAGQAGEELKQKLFYLL